MDKAVLLQNLRGLFEHPATTCYHGEHRFDYVALAGGESDTALCS